MDLITNQLSKKIHTYLSELYYFELLIRFFFLPGYNLLLHLDHTYILLPILEPILPMNDLLQDLFLDINVKYPFISLAKANKWLFPLTGDTFKEF